MILEIQKRIQRKNPGIYLYTSDSLKINIFSFVTSSLKNNMYSTYAMVKYV